MIKNITLLFIVLMSFGCNSNSQTVTIYKKNEVMPVISVTETSLYPAAIVLCDLFEEATGVRPSVIGTEPDKDKLAITIGFFKNEWDAAFSIAHVKDNVVAIKGGNIEQVHNAVRYFFTEYTGLTQFTGPAKKEKADEITIPVNLAYKHTPDFEYREPYFPANFDDNFRRWNMTHTLEEEWALWGHNIGKVIRTTPGMYARVDGEVYKDQFCFSSPELQAALIKYIKGQAKENPEKEKFMIMPNDDAVVCQCSACTATGNTKMNASPAVFTLLNKLAKEFPEQQFFSTAYITTQTPPEFKLEKNGGVMLSTMSFPKGVAVASSDKKDLVGKTFSGWKKVTDKIYLWDYAINFDNYFDFYPTVSISQQNLQFYKAKGVTGVFMQGSEDRYSAFADLKCYLYAQLLQNTEVNLSMLTSRFFSHQYPEVNDLLFDYYTKIEDLSFKSKQKMDIYGGTGPAKKKYMNESGFNLFYDNLIKTTDTITASKNKELQSLLLAFTFQKLELLRTTPDLDDTGYATIVKDSVAKLKPEIPVLLSRLKKLQAKTGIDIYNESGASLKEYIKNWESMIIAQGYKNLLYGKNLLVTSKLDEDYPDGRVLTDGAIGFNDYYNNWLIVTSDTLAVKIDPAGLEKANMLVMNFLNDPRHKIYMPKQVSVVVGSRRYSAEVKPYNDEKNAGKNKVSIPIVIKKGDKAINIQVIKQAAYLNKSIACDEIFIIKNTD